MGHALLSPSSAHRWMACTPSARLEETQPDSISVHAEKGSLAHQLAETLNAYNLNRIKKAQMNKTLKSIQENPLYDEEMQEYIEGFSRYIWELYNAAKAVSKDAVMAIEEKLDLRNYVPEGFGTGDVVMVADGVLTIIDLKYGQGVLVSAEGNQQMMLYALGAFEKYDMLYGINTVKMVIYQPRRDNISEWEISTEALIAWAETELKEKAALAYDGGGDFSPGEHCQFCRAKATCRARAEENLKLAAYDFKPSELLSHEEIADILKVSERLSRWAEDVAAYALDQALHHGVKFEGWKLVEGQSKRVIAEPKIVGEILSGLYDREQIYTEKLKGIGALEKLMGKDQLREVIGAYIVKPAGKPNLALESDKRPEWNRAAAAATEFAETTKDAAF